MGEIRADAPPVTLVIAAFSRFGDLLDALPQTLQSEFGPIALTGPRVEFVETDYYVKQMGPGLLKQIFAFDGLRGADELAAVKRRTNDLEVSLGAGIDDVPRPLNLDPGYVDSGKFVLASTKDHAHRLYLQDGIFAEVTLYLRQKRWEVWPWTYPDYRRPDVQAFLLEVREFHRRQLQFAGGHAAS